MRLLIEATCIGIITTLVALIVGSVLRKFMAVKLPAECKNWNKNHIMELNLFITGFLIHIIFEYTGLNKWYCLNYVRNMS